MEYYTGVLKKYADFSGRARPAEYWMFALINLVVVIGLVVVDAVIQTGAIIIILYYLAILIPALAVSVRRLHDTNRSGWWMLLAFVPFGGIVLLVFFIQDSQPGPNQFGPNPKGVEGYGGGPRDVAEEIARLAALRESGALTEDEFNNRKAALLR